MSQSSGGTASAFERSCSVTAVAFSGGRRAGARLVTGAQRGFGLDAALTHVHVPYPTPAQWARRSVTCAVALQCSPSKERIVTHRLGELAARELTALVSVEASVALGWVARYWPGLMGEFRRVLPEMPVLSADLSADEMLHRAIALAGGQVITPDPLLGVLPVAYTTPERLSDKLRRQLGRMPWTTVEKRIPQPYSIPAGGDGGVRNPNLPPPSRPGDDDLDVTPERRTGIPYPEWNVWTRSFLPGHVAVLERRVPSRTSAPPLAAELRAWFQAPTQRAIANRQEDGSDLDVDSYVGHHVDLATGKAMQPKIFRELQPNNRDVTTALLLDGSASLGVHGGRIFRLELSCADALSKAMTSARERHGIFVFAGNTRHRVDVRCLKDFDERRFVPPSDAGLATGGYTRLGAPLRHLTSRLTAQPSVRRLLIVIGDGLMSDEGYEGRYAWADTAHAVDEADDAGVSVYYVGVGPARVDPLPEVFGSRRSQRIRRVEELPRVLARIHRELIAV